MTALSSIGRGALGLVLAAFIVQAIGPARDASAAPLATPFCSASDLAASIGGTAGSRTTIALVNVTKHTCVLNPYPRVSLISAHDDVTPVNVAISRMGAAHANVAIAAGAAGSFTLAWSGAGPKDSCHRVDAHVILPHGLPLWVPIDANTCSAPQQSAIALGSARLPSPSARAVLSAWTDWQARESCDADLGIYLKGGQSAFSAPKHADALTFDTTHATTFVLLASPPQNTETVLFDPNAALLGEQQSVGTSYRQYVVCGRQRSIPYGVAYGSLGAARTKRGIGIGMTPAQVIHIDGPSHVYTIRSGYSTLGYVAPPNSHAASNPSAVLVVLFYAGRVVGILSSGVV